MHTDQDIVDEGAHEEGALVPGCAGGQESPRESTRTVEFALVLRFVADCVQRSSLSHCVS